jgi:hypothetical protein
MKEDKKTLTLYGSFLGGYDADAKDSLWEKQSNLFRSFWKSKIMVLNDKELDDSEIDEIVRILDKSGKGSTPSSEAVAKAMIAQGAWRRMFREIKNDVKYSTLLNNIFTESDLGKKASLIDQLYKLNENNKNNLTGPSGNAVNTMLAAWDSAKNLSVVSLYDRKKVVDYFEFKDAPNFETDTIGKRTVFSNNAIITGFQALGINASARTISRFLYSPNIKHEWKIDVQVSEVKKGKVEVSIPDDSSITSTSVKDKKPRESIKMQALLASIGEKMGLEIWIPKNDRGLVMEYWHPKEKSLLSKLPLNYDSATMGTIEWIDVLWIHGRSIERAFEVEHTTSIYSGILRMADLKALQPNLDIKTYIVAPSERREDVFRELTRPVFSLLEGKPLSEFCSYISYDSLQELEKHPYLEHTRPEVVDEYAERAAID